MEGEYGYEEQTGVRATVRVMSKVSGEQNETPNECTERRVHARAPTLSRKSKEETERANEPESRKERSTSGYAINQLIKERGYNCNCNIAI